MRRFWNIAAMAVLTCWLGGCGTIVQTALGVPVMMARVAEVPLHHTEEMARITVGAAADTTKHVAGEAIRAGSSERIAAQNAKAQVQIAQIQAQQSQILAQQEQLRVQQAQLQAQLAQSRAPAGTSPSVAPSAGAESPAVSVAMATASNATPAARVAGGPPSMSSVVVSPAKSSPTIPAATTVQTVEIGRAHV